MVNSWVNILIACEFSGTVRDAFIKRGHRAISCDLLPTEKLGPHYQGDVRELLNENWDIIIAHPPCTRLANSGARWLAERNLWGELEDACEFFNMFKNNKCKRIAIENPVPHCHAREKIGMYSQKIHPWNFGDNFQKGVCLWLKNLPPLKLEVTEKPKEVNPKFFHNMPGRKSRAQDRSRFFPGVARAMAEQWG